MKVELVVESCRSPQIIIRAETSVEKDLLTLLDLSNREAFLNGACYSSDDKRAYCFNVSFHAKKQAAEIHQPPPK